MIMVGPPKLEHLELENDPFQVRNLQGLIFRFHLQNFGVLQDGPLPVVNLGYDPYKWPKKTLLLGVITSSITDRGGPSWRIFPPVPQAHHLPRNTSPAGGVSCWCSQSRLACDPAAVYETGRGTLVFVGNWSCWDLTPNGGLVREISYFRKIQVTPVAREFWRRRRIRGKVGEIWWNIII